MDGSTGCFQHPKLNLSESLRERGVQPHLLDSPLNLIERYMAELKDVIIPDTELDLKEIAQETTKDLLSNRKKELSNKVQKLYHKVDALAGQERKEKQALSKTQKRLANALVLVDRLNAGDWSVVSELDKIDMPEENKTDLTKGQ